MNTMMEDIGLLFSRELSSLKNEIELFPDDQMLWDVLPGITNSAGNLALHVCGNLEHFIGAVLGNTGYIRNRDSEFNTKSGSRTEMIRTVEETDEVIQSVLPNLSESIITEKYPEAVGGVELPCGRFLIHLTNHLSFHLGQVGYLRRILTKNNQSSGAISIGAMSI